MEAETAAICCSYAATRRSQRASASVTAGSGDARLDHMCGDEMINPALPEGLLDETLGSWRSSQAEFSAEPRAQLLNRINILLT